MTVHQAPLGLRAYFSSFIAFFLVVFSFSFFLNHIQNQTQSQVATIDNKENQNNPLVNIQEQSPNQTPVVDSHDQSPFLVDVDVTQLKNQNQKQDQTEFVDRDDERNELKERVISIGGDNSSISHGGEEKDKCDWSVGRWVYDNVTRPLYSGPQCKFMHDEVACDKYGRKDIRYQHWRWQPNGCDLPRFDANIFLEKIRGKRMVFVGDSLNRNQWVSMVCLVESVVPEGQKTRTFNGSLMSFKVLSHNVSIDFYWSPLLVESNCDNPIIHRVSSRIMRAYKIESHAKNWMDADIIVFNSYLWWKKPGMKMKIFYGTFEDGDAVLEQVEMFEGFEVALKSWSQWLERNLNNTDKRMFFVSLSPTHVWGQEWGAAPDATCYSETEPIHKEGYRSDGSDYGMMHTAERVIENLKPKGVNVQIVNITQLSEYRKDGHPSIYRRQYVNLTEAQLANPKSYSDCTHWCLPGVPDVWNEFLYAYITSS
ncbi:hypothetical protein LUZ61_013255 [Rhynchospora tenuis]|uniref:Trichome birefringence-like N-terminal domain-containing protein n=1 Tax=Rhynchospora tenuis TaxID=198213 RepID=A0AAD5W8Q8_9POAL|nr:hypothetical protein LUZ61_013255 [Rhynchospora tenuis]